MRRPKPKLPHPRGRWGAVLALIAAGAGVAVIVLTNARPSTHGNGAGTTATGAVTVQRRNLVATDTESGTLSYADPQTVYNRLSGTITWVPQVGRIIRPGQTLFDVDNRPVLLMNGSTPAYRELSAADTTGPDVYELNRNLVELGYDPDGIVVDDEWQAATTAGIERMQYDLGETETGTLALGQVVFLPGPQMIQTVDTTVGSTAAGYAGGAPQPLFVAYAKDGTTTGTTTTGAGTGTGTSTSTTTGTNTGTGTGTTTAPSTTPTSPVNSGARTTPSGGGSGSGSGSGSGDSLSRRTLQALLRLVRQQQQALRAQRRAPRSPSTQPSSPSPGGRSPSSGRGSSHTPSSGSGNSGHGATGSTGHGSTGSTGHGGSGGTGGGAANAVAVLSSSSTKLVVTVDLSASSQSEATIGERVTVQMPNGSTVGGHITAVSPVAQSSSSAANGGGGGGGGVGGGGGGGGGSGSATVPVTVGLDRHARGGGLDQAAVSVNFVQSKASHVLSVPVTALLATSGSSFAVQEAAAPHRLIPVQTGLFAAGYVEISGAGIHPGLRVTDSQG